MTECRQLGLVVYDGDNSISLLIVLEESTQQTIFSFQRLHGGIMEDAVAAFECCHSPWPPCQEDGCLLVDGPVNLLWKKFTGISNLRGTGIR